MRQVAQRARDGSLVVVETPAPALQPGWVLVAQPLLADQRRHRALEGRARRQEPAPEGARAARPRPAGGRPRPRAGRPRRRSRPSATGSTSSPRSATRPRASCSRSAPASRASRPATASRAAGAAGRTTPRSSPCRRTSSRTLPEGVVVRAGAPTPPSARSRCTASARRGGRRRVRRRDRARARRAARDAHPARLGLLGGRHRPRRRAPSSSRASAGVTAFLTRRPRSSSARVRRADRRPRPRRGADLRRVALGRSARAGRAPGARPRPPRRRRRRRRSQSTARSLYEKELELRLVRSYGPGRYDREYEERGRDLAARRTSAGRSSATCRRSSTWSPAGGSTSRELTTHRFPIDDAPEAYAAAHRRRAGSGRSAIVLEYDGGGAGGAPRAVAARAAASPTRPGWR